MGVRVKKTSSQYRTYRPIVRQTAFSLDASRCIWPTCRKWIGDIDYAHEHEVIYRGRGGDPLDVDNVVTLCAECHSHIHARIGGLKKRMTGSRKLGIVFEERQRDGSWEVVT